MKEEKLLEERIGRNPGFKVPEGYFDDLYSKVSASLPEYPEAPRAPRLSTWQKLKPYVYMAAMFAGIWCMMKVFHTAASGSTNLSLDTPPEAVAVVMADPEAADVYLRESYESDFELESEVLSQYDSMSDFEKDFGYDLKPEYANMHIPA
ncbi:MAG: hypothetical protein HDR95_02090 [Bacteroides sp.]|nr:hypothetical protein [Bacteroides sp.]MBD5336090.1 hypothetical protein [Bacteroides sp.]